MLNIDGMLVCCHTISGKRDEMNFHKQWRREASLCWADSVALLVFAGNLA